MGPGEGNYGGAGLEGSEKALLVYPEQEMVDTEGFSVAARIALTSALTCAPLSAEVPKVPSPPLFETAATRGPEVAVPMPPRTIGWVMPRRSQMRV